MAPASSLPRFIAKANPTPAQATTLSWYWYYFEICLTWANSSREVYFSFAWYNHNPTPQIRTATQNASHESALVPISAHHHLPRSEGFTVVPLPVFESWWMHSPHYTCCWSQSEGTRSHTGPGTALLRHSGNMLEICWEHDGTCVRALLLLPYTIPCLIPFVKPIDQHFPRIAIGNVPQLPK